MKKVVFLTMVFGLMMVFSGSISAHERPGKVDDNCAGVTPKKGDRISFRLWSTTGESDCGSWCPDHMHSYN